MRIPIELTTVGFDQDRATLAGWTRRVGDRVERGDVIVEVETEKVTAGVEALDSGTLVEIVHDAGDEVSVGTVIGWLDDGQ
jgi:pyruvate/2-oxoglutarate dehydrogenase complex dihydrolipoamide acyltransferase (E2) component